MTSPGWIKLNFTCSSTSCYFQNSGSTGTTLVAAGLRSGKANGAGNKKKEASPAERVGLALTVTPDAARRLVGPDAQTGANDAGGPIGRVAGLAAVRQQGARRKGSPVGLRPVEQVPVLHAERPRATCRRDREKQRE